MKGLLTIFSILYLSLLSATSQLSQDELDTCRIYTTLESALANPDDVYILKLPKIKAKEFPTEILQFKNLNVLDLSKNKLSELPDTLALLQQLLCESNCFVVAIALWEQLFCGGDCFVGAFALWEQLFRGSNCFVGAIAL